MRVLDNLEPKKVFYYFEELCNIPHGSQNTKQISDYLVSFAQNHGLEYYQDEMNNVVMISEATAGYENSEPIIIQGHMDMVCEKENGVDIDFEKDGLKLKVDGDFVKAEGTTLGGDDGIAVAYALALLDMDDLKHPRLEVIVTVDEEIGMLGAAAIDLSMLKGHTMLNIDSDEEGYFLTSCAGGMGLNANIPVTRIQQKGSKVLVTITGLQGGHSGAEIDKERGNADILMGRLLDVFSKNFPFGIVSMAGGLKDNAIVRECQTQLICPEEAVETLENVAALVEKEFKTEFSNSDSDVKILVEDMGCTTEYMTDFSSTNKIILYLRTIPNGVQHMSTSMKGFVETSLNLGILELKEDALYTVTSIRSSVPSRKEDLKNKVCQIIEMVGGEAFVEGDYPAWVYKENSPLRDQIQAVYKDLFGKEPVFQTIHAGLECGLFSDKIKDLDCVSFGPWNYDIHTPQERLSISSTERVWKFLVAFIENAK